MSPSANARSDRGRCEATTVGGWLGARSSREEKRPTTMSSGRYLVELLPAGCLKLRMNDESLSPALVGKIVVSVCGPSV
jgi:hypothetical protein